MKLIDSTGKEGFAPVKWRLSYDRWVLLHRGRWPKLSAINGVTPAVASAFVFTGTRSEDPKRWHSSTTCSATFAEARSWCSGTADPTTGRNSWKGSSRTGHGWRSTGSRAARRISTLPSGPRAT